MLHGAYLGTADWPSPGRDGPWSHTCSGIGCGGLAFPADLTVENHGEDHAEDLQREETRQRNKHWRRPPYSVVTEEVVFSGVSRGGWFVSRINQKQLNNFQ